MLFFSPNIPTNIPFDSHFCLVENLKVKLFVMCYYDYNQMFSQQAFSQECNVYSSFAQPADK